MTIRKYQKSDEEGLFNLIGEEGWHDYLDDNAEKYKKALNSSIVYIPEEEGKVCGFARCREDDGYGVYVYDLLVSPRHRGNGIGRMLMEKVFEDFKDQTCYVMSDVDGYYRKLGYQKTDSIFEVKCKK